jgi:hypothetical protein
MALLGPGAALGAGSAVLGGILAGVGSNQAARASGRAAKRNLRNLRAIDTQTQAATDITQQGLGELSQDRQGALSQAVGNFAALPGMNRAGTAQAMSMLQGAPGQLDLKRSPFTQGGMAAQIAAQRRQAALAAPQTNAKAAQLGLQLARPGYVRGQVDTANRMTDIGRRGQELSADDQFRMSQIARALGLSGADYQQALAAAQGTGGLMQALGSSAIGLAPGLAAVGDYYGRDPRAARDPGRIYPEVY